MSSTTRFYLQIKCTMALVIALMGVFGPYSAFAGEEEEDEAEIQRGWDREKQAQIKFYQALKKMPNAPSTEEKDRLYDQMVGKVSAEAAQYSRDAFDRELARDYRIFMRKPGETVTGISWGKNWSAGGGSSQLADDSSKKTEKPEPSLTDRLFGRVPAAATEEVEAPQAAVLPVQSNTMQAPSAPAGGVDGSGLPNAYYFGRKKTK